MPTRADRFERALFELPERVTPIHDFTSKHREIVYDFVHVPTRPNILVLAGVNGAGKSPLEVIASEYGPVKGMSSICAEEVAKRWNKLSPRDRFSWLGNAPYPEVHTHLLECKLSAINIDPLPAAAGAVKDIAYKMKCALGKFITRVMWEVRSPDMGGDAHSVVANAFLFVRTGGTLSGWRTPPDFHFGFCKMLPYVNLRVIYIDAEERQKDVIRGHTERELMAIVPLLKEHFPESLRVVTNNGSREEYEKKVAEMVPEIERFLVDGI